MFTDQDYNWAALGMARYLLNDVLGSDLAVEAHAMLIEDLGADPMLDFYLIQAMLEEKSITAPDIAFHRGITVQHIADLILAEARNTTCRACDGGGEFVFNNSIPADPVNDKGRSCKGCGGSGRVKPMILLAA